MKIEKGCSPYPFALGLVALWSCSSMAPFWANADNSHDGHFGQNEPFEITRTYERMVKSYSVPDVTLLNQDGQTVRLRELVDSGKPVMLNFIFTTCSTICPLLSAGFSGFQVKMGEEAANVTLISITSDPDHDTPPILKEYLRRFDAKPGWEFLTGDAEDIARVMKAFDAYVGNKMDHYPLKFLHTPGAEKWVRIKGLIGGSDLRNEYQKLLETTPASIVPVNQGET